MIVKQAPLLSELILQVYRFAFWTCHLSCAIVSTATHLKKLLTDVMLPFGSLNIFTSKQPTDLDSGS